MRLSACANIATSGCRISAPAPDVPRQQTLSRQWPKLRSRCPARLLPCGRRRASSTTRQQERGTAVTATTTSARSARPDIPERSPAHRAIWRAPGRATYASGIARHGTQRQGPCSPPSTGSRRSAVASSKKGRLKQRRPGGCTDERRHRRDSGGHLGRVSRRATRRRWDRVSG